MTPAIHPDLLAFFHAFAPANALIAAKLRWYALSGGEKHLRDIRSMLRLCRDIVVAFVNRYAEEHGTLAAWRDCQARAGQE